MTQTCVADMSRYMLDMSRYVANSDPDMEHGPCRNFLDMCAFPLNARFPDTSQVRSGHTWRPGLGCSLASLLSLAQSSHNELFQLGVLHLLYIMGKYSIDELLYHSITGIILHSNVLYYNNSIYTIRVYYWCIVL